MDFEVKTEELFPSGNYMLVEPITGEGQTKSGIIINVGSDGAVPTLGRVARHGELSKFHDDDILIFRRYSVDEIKVTDTTGSKKLCFINDEDVIAVIKKNG